MDVQEQLDTKIETLDARAQFADKNRFEQALQRLQGAEQVLSEKCDLKRKLFKCLTVFLGFEAFK